MKRNRLLREQVADIHNLLGWRLGAVAVVGAVSAALDSIRILVAMLIIPFLGIDIVPPFQNQLKDLFDLLNIHYNEFSVAATIAFVFLIQGSIALVLAWYQSGYAAYYTFCWRRKLLNSYSKASWFFFLNTPHGDLPNALSDETMQLQQTVNNLFQLQSRLMVTFAFLVAAFYLDFLVSAIILLFSCVVYILNRFANAFLFKHSRAISKSKRQIIRKAIEFLDNIKTLKGMGIESEAVRVIIPMLRDVMGRFRISFFALNAYRVTSEIVAMISIVVALTLVVGFSLAKEIGTLVILVPLFFRIQGQTTQAAMLFQQVISKLGSFEIVTKTLKSAQDAKEKTCITLHHSDRKHEQLGKGIRFQHVSVCHGDKVVLNEVELNMPIGRITAVVGHSGAGKTTIGDTLLRLHEVTSGNIVVDDQNLADIDLHLWRSTIGYVTQETTLFDTSFLENIRLGCRNASREEVIYAAKIAHAHEFIVSNPEGYYSKVGERGSWLSGGQRQRIALARAVVRKPSLLILDELTSALDPESERIVMEAIENLREPNRIILLITHQLRNIQHADIIYVLKEGRVAESGTWNELIAKNGIFYQLWQKQRWGEKEDISINKTNLE